jgi:hypothetical protein
VIVGSWRRTAERIAMPRASWSGRERILGVSGSTIVYLGRRGYISRSQSQSRVE